MKIYYPSIFEKIIEANKNSVNILNSLNINKNTELLRSIYSK